YKPQRKHHDLDSEGSGCVQRPRLRLERQLKECTARCYKKDNIPSCVSCAEHWPQDTCRFQHIRFFLRKESGELYGFHFQQYDPIPGDFEWRDQWNTPLDESHINETQKTIAAALLPPLREELKDINSLPVIFKTREAAVCVTCADTCLTSIFTGSWTCRFCGREACADCFQKIKTLSIDSEESHGFPASQHHARNFGRTTSFKREELRECITQMEHILSTPSARALPLETTSTLCQAPETTDFEDGAVPFHNILKLTNGSLTKERFRRVWSWGKPFLVTDVGSQLTLPWTPTFFVEEYGGSECDIIECQTNETRPTNVADFFNTFGQYTDREGCWKLKDWPPANDFKETFPELYADFSQASPMPDYTHRDGVLNLASHFPLNAVAPDLGPKMYNAHANLQESHCLGSTRLHMDMADAVNLMAYAAPDPHGNPGCAAWDLFEADASESIRVFIREEFGIQSEDPIHGQQVYLDDGARNRLYQRYGVKSYRVYQTAGQAVFIPAGCAHQVRNLADCIKVAIDFVSPENIRRCEQLTREFREQNNTEAWKEDVLQLRTMMWFAWQSCTRQRK
ncbi:Clavaminate synthase-like protein, partial [Mycena metata]